MKKDLKVPSDRNFGMTFAVVFSLAGAWLTWRGSRFGIPAIGLAAVFALLGWLVPRVLHPLNVIWAHFGMLLNRIVSPIVLGVIFYGVFTPVSMVFRLMGRDALRRSFEASQRSYWIDRSPPGPDGKTFPRQF